MRVRGMRYGLFVAIVALVSCEAPTDPPPAVASVVIGPAVAQLASGASLSLGIVVRDASNNVLEGRSVVWASLNSELATVSVDGVVTAKVNRGSVSAPVTIRAIVEGVAAEAGISVLPVPAASFALVPLTEALSDGDVLTVAFDARDADGQPLLGRQATWISRDISIVEVVGNGQLQPRPFFDVTNRHTVVVATLEGLVDSIAVEVVPSALSAIQILPDEPFLRRGYGKRLRIRGQTTGGSAIDGLQATYVSSNDALVTVTTAGVVTASASTTGTAQVIASYGAVSDTVTVTVDDCGAGSPGTYPIELRNVGPSLSAEVQAAFACARARIRTIIRTEISRVTFPVTYTTASWCFGQTVDAGTSTTGVIILMRVGPIDGAGKVLGRAGPCDVRSTSRLAVIGLMEFDEADIATLISRGTLVEVILHEMLHVIGIGPTWRDPDFPRAIWTGEVADPGFLGQSAMAACRDEHGGINTCALQVPIEDCVGIADCGVGTLYGHWRERIFDSELMTGYIDIPRSPLSRMTIAALGDLGYPVDLEQAEYYTMPTPNVMAGLVLEPGNLRLGIKLPAPVRPTRSIDANGRVRPILY